jgi:PadR family transcriptional regulator, regulatory protein AphA
MKLTTTSYAILGLLDIRDWSAYELAQQAERSLAFVWPVSETQLYAEPKRLSDAGLIAISDAPAGPRRSRQILSITREGRRELKRWLAREPAHPRLQMEVLLRCLFATSGTRESLLEAVQATRDAAVSQYERGMQILSGYLDGENPFPERLHANILWMVLVRDFCRLMVDWTAFASSEISQWTDARRGGDARRLSQLLDDLSDPTFAKL